MRRVIGFIVLAVLAVLAAAVLAHNDGLVSVFWRGTRLDVSLNLFLAVLVLGCVVLYVGLHALNVLFGLPRRAAEWRASRADRAAQATLRHALSYYFAGRYTRAHRSAMRAIGLRDQAETLRSDHEFTALAHLIAAGSLHRLQDRPRRDEQLGKALSESAQIKGPRPVEEGARLQSAEWAIDDRNAPLAMEQLSALNPGVARRTQSLRLRLQAARLAGQHADALRTARLLAKHQGFSPVAATGLLRTLADAVLDGARDSEQLQRIWAELDTTDRRDPLVTARAAARMARLGGHTEAREWLRPFFEQLGSTNDDEREALCAALVAAVPGLPADWLPRLEAAALAMPRDPVLAHAVGRALFERQLWGKARRQLEMAAQTPGAPAAVRRDAWLHLARIARQQDDQARAAHCFEQAAEAA